MNPDELTIKEARELAAMFSGEGMTVLPQHPYKIGACYLIRTVTMIDTGIVLRVTQQEIVLKDAAWIADTGRFADAVKKAEFGEVEPFPDGEVIVGRAAVVDAVQIIQAPRSQK